MRQVWARAELSNKLFSCLPGFLVAKTQKIYHEPETLDPSTAWLSRQYEFSTCSEHLGSGVSGEVQGLAFL